MAAVKTSNAAVPAAIAQMRLEYGLHRIIRVMDYICFHVFEAVEGLLKARWGRSISGLALTNQAHHALVRPIFHCQPGGDPAP